MLGGHTYSFFSHCLAQLYLDRLYPSPELLAQSDRAVDFLLRSNGLTITGGVGLWECWTDDQDGRAGLAETCSTTYQLALYDSLLRLRADPVCGDLIERTLYNTAFAAQSPDGRRLRYFTPFEGLREFYNRDDYCCPNNYRRLIASLPSLIYYTSTAGGIVVNLYTTSEATVPIAGNGSVTVRQRTDYPSSGHVELSIEPSAPASFPLLLRIPGWCRGATISVNASPTSAPTWPGHFLKIEREWKPGDVVTMELPMPWRFVAGRERQAGRAALMRGPVVYTLNPAQDSLLAKSDAADIGRIVLLPDTAEPPIADASVRPGGTACRIKAQREGFGLADKPNVTLILTEFPDPDGQCIYFRLPPAAKPEPDELRLLPYETSTTPPCRPAAEHEHDNENDFL